MLFNDFNEIFGEELEPQSLRSSHAMVVAFMKAPLFTLLSMYSPNFHAADAQRRSSSNDPPQPREMPKDHKFSMHSI